MAINKLTNQLKAAQQLTMQSKRHNFYRTVPIFGRDNRETTGGNYTITRLNIGQDKNIKVLENEAEILHHCDDRAVQSVSEKDQLSDDVMQLSPDSVL